MPPQPKPPGARVRRNRDQPQWRRLEGRVAGVPPLPARKPAWLAVTRSWWKAIWASPMATAWLPADVPTLVRLARIVELDNRGEASAALLAEARQLEDRFGLSPMARRRLQWEVFKTAEGEADVPLPAAAAASSRPRGRLRAV